MVPVRPSPARQCTARISPCPSKSRIWVTSISVSPVDGAFWSAMGKCRFRRPCLTRRFCGKSCSVRVMSIDARILKHVQVLLDGRGEAGHGGGGEAPGLDPNEAARAGAALAGMAHDGGILEAPWIGR